MTGVPARDTVFAVVPEGMTTDAVESAARVAFARRMPLLDYDDVPDLSFEHSVIRTVDGLSALMQHRRPRARSHGVDEP